MIDKFKEYREIAIDALRKAAMIVITQASETRIKVITDRIEASYTEEDGYSIKIDGHEIADAAMGATIEFTPGKPPTINWTAKPKAIPLKAEEEAELLGHSRNFIEEGSSLPCKKGM